MYIYIYMYIFIYIYVCMYIELLYIYGTEYLIIIPCIVYEIITESYIGLKCHFSNFVLYVHI